MTSILHRPMVQVPQHITDPAGVEIYFRFRPIVVPDPNAEILVAQELD